MVRVLFISPTFPYPPTDGGRLRKFNTLRIVADEHDVDLLSVADTEPTSKQLAHVQNIVSNVEHFRYPNYRFHFNTVVGLAQFKPFQTRRYYFRSVQRWIDSREDEYDLVYCSTVQSTPYVMGKSVSRVVDFVDSYARKYRNLGEATSGLRQYIYPIESRRLTNYERSVIRDFDHSIVISERDRQFIESEGRFDSLSVIPNGVRNELLTYEPPKSNSVDLVKPTIVFLGTMNYPPNEDAVKYFAEDILPVIRESYPEAGFLIVGKSPTKAIRKLAERPEISVTGFVEEPADYLLAADVVVAPLRYGSGLQNKVLEALALSKPIVTTSVGFEGLDGTEGTHLLVGDTPQGFAEHVCEIIDNPKRGRELGENGRRLVENCYTWEKIAPELRSIINDALDCA